MVPFNLLLITLLREVRLSLSLISDMSDLQYGHISLRLDIALPQLKQLKIIVCSDREFLLLEDFGPLIGSFRFQSVLIQLSVLKVLLSLK